MSRPIGDHQAGRPDRDHHARGEDGLAPRFGDPVHEPGRLEVEAEGETEGGVHEEVDPQHLGRVEGRSRGDVEERGTQEREDEDDEEDEHEADVLGEIVEDLAALLDRVDDRGEVVVGEDHPRGVLGHLGAAPHGDPDVGRLDGRGVVDAVAGHGHDLTLRLEGVDEQHLVLGRDPAEHPDVVDPIQALGL